MCVRESELDTAGLVLCPVAGLNNNNNNNNNTSMQLIFEGLYLCSSDRQHLLFMDCGLA